jgi:hypothetical protein
MREIHSKTDRTGNAITGDKKKSQYYNENDVPDVTMRNIHEKTDRTGNAITGDKKKSQYYNENDVPDITMREIHSKTDRTGNAITGDKKKSQYYNENDVPDVTMREIHSKTDRTGNGVTGEKQKGKYYNPNDVPDVTMREIHSKTDRTGNGVTGEKQKGKYIDFNDIPDVTMREIYGKTNWKGPYKEYVGRPKPRDDDYNSKVNITREIVAKGRVPTQIKQNIGPTTGFTEYRFKDPENSEYINHPGIQIKKSDNLKFEMRNEKNPTWWFNNRLSDFPDKNLSKNPYVNNIVHKAVIKFD